MIASPLRRLLVRLVNSIVVINSIKMKHPAIILDFKCSEILDYNGNLCKPVIGHYDGQLY